MFKKFIYGKTLFKKIISYKNPLSALNLNKLLAKSIIIHFISRMENLPQQTQQRYPQLTQPSNHGQSQPIHSQLGHPQPINGHFQPGLDQPQPGQGQPQSLYSHMQYQPNTQSPYALGPNQPFDSLTLNKIKELESSLDKGWYLCFKVLLWLLLIGSFFQIFSIFGPSHWFTVASGFITFIASELALSAMKDKRTQHAQQAFSLFLIETIFVGLNLNGFYRTTKDNRYSQAIFPITCVIAILLLSLVVRGTYKVMNVLKERDLLKSDLETPLNQNMA